MSFYNRILTTDERHKLFFIDLSLVVIACKKCLKIGNFLFNRE